MLHVSLCCFSVAFSAKLKHDADIEKKIRQRKEKSSGGISVCVHGTLLLPCFYELHSPCVQTATARFDRRAVCGMQRSLQKIKLISK